jgi:hypothetical protein
MLICFIGWTVCSALYQDSGNVGAGRAVIAFIWLFSVSYAYAWSGLLVAYTVEIMPFKIRAKGLILMVMNFWVQVALVINLYVQPCWALIVESWDLSLDAWNPSYHATLSEYSEFSLTVPHTDT